MTLTLFLLKVTMKACGDQIRGKSGYLLLDELPNAYVMEGAQFTINCGQAFSGAVGVFHEPEESDMRDINVPLDIAIQRALMDRDACFVTLGTNTCVVLQQGHYFAVFDPHKRNSQVHVDADTGKAVVVYHCDYRALYEHMENLVQQLLPYFRTLKDTPFEVRGVKVRITGDMEQHSDMPTTKEDTVKNKSQEDGRPLYSAVLKGEHKRPATCSNSFDEHVTKKRRHYCEATYCDLQAITNNPPTASVMNTSHANDTDKNTDVEIINVSRMPFSYKPLSAVTKGRLCSEMGVRSENTKQLPLREMLAMGRVCETKSIEGDGNCFFRALSYAISGSENGHMKLRRGIVQHLETHAAEFHNYLRAEHSSVPHHLNPSKMRCSGSFSTEIEIWAAANLLQVDIYTQTDGIITHAFTYQVTIKQETEVLRQFS